MTSYDGQPIETHQRSFEWYHPCPLRPLLPQDLGLQPQPKNAIAIISEKGKAADLADTFTGSIRTKAHEN